MTPKISKKSSYPTPQTKLIFPEPPPPPKKKKKMTPPPPPKKKKKCPSLGIYENRVAPSLLQQNISEPVFYGNLVYKFKRIVGKPNLSDQFKKIFKHYKRVGYNMDSMRHSACF